MCNNKVEMYVRTMSDLNTTAITFNCGDYTSAGLAQCDECKAKADADYPQGWFNYPGDKCKHGVYVGGDRDCACYRCETEELCSCGEPVVEPYSMGMCQACLDHEVGMPEHNGGDDVRCDHIPNDVVASSRDNIPF
jgi:hypothetical protein